MRRAHVRTTQAQPGVADLLHVLQMTSGVDLWPSALKLPLLPRLGFPQHGAW